MRSFCKLLLLLGFCFIADPQQLCRRNERYAECGRCEATCKNPNMRCRHGCLPSRCECIAALNYVRDRHGACIKITDCDVPTMLVAFESGGAFRKIFGKLYNEGIVEDAGRTGRAKSDELSTATHPSDVEGVHSYPPENLFPQTVTHSHPPERLNEGMSVHSYPSEHRLHDVPVYRYSRNYRPRTTASYDYPSYDLPEDGGVYSYPPEYPEEVGTHEYAPLPFVSDYGNIASHQSGTFYYQQGKKDGKRKEQSQHYDPYGPLRFEKAKVRSKLKESSILRQVPPEVSKTLRDIGGTSSLRELANAKVLFEFQPDDIENQKIQVEPTYIGTPGPSATATPIIPLQATTTLPRSNHFSDIAMSFPETTTATSADYNYREPSTGPSLSASQETVLPERRESVPNGSAAAPHSRTSTQRESHKPSNANLDYHESGSSDEYETFDCPCATASSLEGVNNVTQMTTKAPETLNVTVVTELPIRTSQADTTHRNGTPVEESVPPTQSNHRSNGWTRTSSSQKGTNNVTQATVQVSPSKMNTSAVPKPSLEPEQSVSTHEKEMFQEVAPHPTPEKHRSDGWSQTVPIPEGANNSTQKTVNAPAEKTTVVGEPVQGSRHLSHALKNASSQEPVVPSKHRNDGWSRPSSHLHTNVQKTVAIVLPQSSASSSEQFNPQFRKFAVSSQLHHPSSQHSNRLSYTFNTPHGTIFFEKSSLYRKH